MIGEDLQSGPDDEENEEHVQEVLHLQPPGKPGIHRWRRLGDARMLDDEGLHFGHFAEGLGDGDQHHERPGPDRERPKHANPAAADAHARDDTGLGRHPVIRQQVIVGVGKGCLQRLRCRALAAHFFSRLSAEPRCMAM